jgi:membrane fusion protein, multidrug efflux system
MIEDRPIKRRPRRAVLWSVVGVLVIGVAVAASLLIARNAGSNGKSDKKKEDKSAPPAPVELSAVLSGSISTFLETTATLEAQNAATLVARAEGPVIELLAEEGAYVKKGQVLARLDDTEARLAVERTELGWELAKREHDRGQQLQAKDYLSQKELDDKELGVRNAWVALEQARYDLLQTKIVAPFSGRLVERMIHLGETVAEGKDCFRIVDFDPVRARLYFPERELARVRVGQIADLSFDTHPGQTFPARVAIVNPVVDRANGTFKVTVELPNAAGTLRPGAFARVRVKTGTFAEAMLIPRRGVVTEDGESYVFVARGDSVIRVSVSVGAVENDTAQILSGLVSGDSVVTVGQGGLKPGSKIRAVTL